MPPTEGGDPSISRLVRDAYGTSVDVETASRHLWRLYQVAGTRGGRGARRTLVSVLAAVLLFATAAVTVVVSGDAVPGDSLYVVKRGAERVHLMVSFAPESDARLHLRFARSRAVEAQRVAASRPDRVPVLLTEIVAAFERADLVGGTGVAEEMEVLRGEVSTALSGLNDVVDADLAASVDATLRELGDGRAVSGTGEDAPGLAEDAPGLAEDAPGPPMPQPGPPGEGHRAPEPSAEPTVEPTAEPTVEPTVEPTAEPAAPTGPAELIEAPQPPVREDTGSTEGAGIPALDDLEGLLDDSSPEPGP